MTPTAPTRLRFLGAAGTVTGSRYLIEAMGRRILVDCGLFQGSKQLRARNRKPFPVRPNTTDTIPHPTNAIRIAGLLAEAILSVVTALDLPVAGTTRLDPNPVERTSE